MGCVLGRPGSPGSVSGSRQHEVSSTRIESNRKEVNSVSVTKTETTEIAASVAVAAAASNGEEEIRKDEEAIVEQKEPNGVVVTETKERRPKSERKRSKPDPRRSNPPKNLLGEQVAAGWPTWLSEVCGEALSGWLPRKADSFEKIDKVREKNIKNLFFVFVCPL